MSIFIGADHRGFELKNKIVEYLQEKNIRVEDMGAYDSNPLDDYPFFAKKVAQGVLQNPKEFIGIVICSSGIGVSIAANRYPGIRCALGFDVAQVKHGRENDHANILAIPSDFVDLEKTKLLIDTFIEAKPKMEDKYLRRLQQIEER